VTLGSTSRPATSQPPCLGRKPNARVATGKMCSGRGFVVVTKNFSFVAILDEWGMREERAGAKWAAPAWPPSFATRTTE